MDIKDLVNSTGVSKERIQNMNVDLDLDNLKVGDAVNFDAGTLDDAIDPFTRVGTDVGANFNKAAVESGGSPQDFMNTVKLDQTGQVTAESLLAPKDITTMTAQEAQLANRYQEWLNASKNQLGTTTTVAPPPPDPSLVSRMKDEITSRYDFDKAPIASTLTAVQDVGTATQLIDPETLEYGDYGYNTPMYVGAGSQDMDVMVPTAQRNFNAYSNMGQYGSTSRIYDSILMNPVSTWSRDLSSRFS